MDNPIFEKHYAFFRAIPWCSGLFDDPDFRLHHFIDGDPKPDTEDSFMAETLNTPLAVPAVMVFASLPKDPFPMPVRQVRVLFALGSGLNGHAHLAHGGFLVTLFDEAQGILLNCNKDLQAENLARPGSMTAMMKVDYIAPVKTPQVVLMKAWLREVSGRKYFIDSTLEDGNGKILMKGESLWIGTHPIKAKPRL